MIRFLLGERLVDPALGVAKLGDLLEHRLDVRGRAAVERARKRADRGRERGSAVRAGRGRHPRGEGRGVQAVLGRADPVRVDRLDVLRVGLAAPAQQELLRSGRAPARRRRRAPPRGRPQRPRSARRSPSSARTGDRDPRRACSSEISLSLPRPHSPARRAVSAWRSAGALPVRRAGSYGSGSGIFELEVVVDEQAPDVLVRVVADELLDVDRRGSGARRPRGRARRSPSRRRRRPRGLA